MLRSMGSSLMMVRRYDDTLPGWGQMLANDQFYVADIDGDSRDDLYVFNGVDWSIAYLEKLQSVRNTLSFANRFDGDVPGWGDLKPNDQFYVADINGDGLQDLYVYNALDWVTEYLGVLRSTGVGGLSGSWQDDWIGNWNLGRNDLFLVGNFNGGAGWDDLYIRNTDWFGLLRSQSNSTTQVSIHPRWIHDHRFHVNGWW
jgi:hypothetical protein